MTTKIAIIGIASRSPPALALEDAPEIAPAKVAPREDPFPAALAAASHLREQYIVVL
jgi:hypothetical protein